MKLQPANCYCYSCQFSAIISFNTAVGFDLKNILLTWGRSWQSCSPQTWWSSPPPGPAWHPSHLQPSGQRSWLLPSWAGCRLRLSLVPAMTGPCLRTTGGSGTKRSSRVLFKPKSVYRCARNKSGTAGQIKAGHWMWRPNADVRLKPQRAILRSLIQPAGSCKAFTDQSQNIYCRYAAKNKRSYIRYF